MSSSKPPQPSGSPSATAADYVAVSGVSDHLDTRTAAMDLVEQFQRGLRGRCDLMILFASYHHRSAFADAARMLRETVRPRTLLGVTAEAVLGGAKELDGRAGLAGMAMQLGGARLHVFTTTPDDPIPLHAPESVRKRIGLNDQFRTAILLADPFTTPIARLLPALTACGEGQQVPIVGGMASGASQPGLNVMILNDRVLTAGGVGVSLSGDIDLDFIVSQGCRPIGKPMVVTKAHENIILELGSRRALDALQDMAERLSETERGMLSHGLLIGTVINEYKERFGRGDFLVRNLLGIDQKSGGIVVGEKSMVGHTVQFHVRDAATAAEDLQLLLDAQQLKNPPFGALLFTCNGRGAKLFGRQGHDLNMIHSRLGRVPTAGFFAAGELGPIGDRSFLHGHTASMLVLRGVER